jgi:hypothetical protein
MAVVVKNRDEHHADTPHPDPFVEVDLHGVTGWRAR